MHIRLLVDAIDFHLTIAIFCLEKDVSFPVFRAFVETFPYNVRSAYMLKANKPRRVDYEKLLHNPIVGEQ